jgi:hypothetical protein
MIANCLLISCCRDRSGLIFRQRTTLLLAVVCSHRRSQNNRDRASLRVTFLTARPE